MRKAKPICLRLLTQLMRWARALALAKAGRSRPARMAMMAITTSNSISVKAPSLGLVLVITIVFFILSGSRNIKLGDEFGCQLDSEINLAARMPHCGTHVNPAFWTAYAPG